MAKRRAEPLVCHVPCKRFVSCRLPRAEPAPRAPASKRKREAAAGEDEAPPGDTGGVAGRRRQQQQQHEGDAGSCRLQEGCGGRGGARAAAELAEEYFQYNSFQYWRAPLPTLQLSDIQDVTGENATKARIPSRPEIMETEMET